MENINCEFNTISFSIYTPEEIRKLAVKEIKSFISIEPTLGKGSVDGLYDSKLGPLSEREPCRTCNLSFFECNGHFGVIEFPKPVYNPVLFNTLFKFIKGVCFYCHKINEVQGLNEVLYTLNLKEMKHEIKSFTEVEELKSMPHDLIIDKAIKCISQAKKGSSKCSHCGKINLLFDKSRKAEIIVHISTKLKKEVNEPPQKKQKCDDSEFDLEKPIKNEMYDSMLTKKELYSAFRKEKMPLMPEILREHLRFLWINEHVKMSTILPFLNNSNFKYPTDIFFMENMLVNPPMNRVPAVMSGEKLIESPETANMSLVIKACSALSIMLNNTKSNVTDEQKFHNIREAVFELQQRLNTCLDSGTHKNLNLVQPGLRQKIDKKAGLFRKNINAKRVNFACRSVISPDPNIGLDEIGVPVVFLKKLTFPEYMNPMNKDFLRQSILNGPDVYPGAESYSIDDSIPTKLKNSRDVEADLIEAKMQGGSKVIVYRHAMDGDTLIMNRQPSLHRVSMQAHKINAIADLNAKTLRMHYSNCKAYNADFDGDEMNGHYMQSVLSQTESKIIVNVANQHSTAKDGSPLAGLIQDHVIAGCRLCVRDCFLERHEYYDLVIFGLRNNYISPLKVLPPAIIFPKRLWTGKQILSTILINSIPEGYKLPNIVLHEPKKNELWKISKEEEKLKLSDIDLVIVDGYICTGMFDKVHLGPSQKGLCSDLRELYGNETALQILTNFSRCLNRYLIYTGFSTSVKDGFLNEEAESVKKKISYNIKCAGLASISTAFNVTHRNSDLRSIVGLMERAHFDKSDEFKNKMKDIDINFKCLSNKYMNELSVLSKNSLRESFPVNNLLFMANTGAKGGDSNVKKIAVALGAVEIEGQRTPLTFSGRTLPSFVRYDTDPLSRGFCMSRFTTGLKPQELFFESMAGRDGLVDTAVKTSISGYLQRCLIKNLEDITVKYDGTVRDNMDNIIQFKYGYDGLDIIKSMSLSNVDNMEVICRNISHFKKKLLGKNMNMKVNDGILTKMDRNKIDSLVAKMKNEQINLTNSDKENLSKIIVMKKLSSQCEAGEAVGLLAAQSIGEPSTQMTLNTFHNAGQSEMNVTLGIPRLKEILMIGSEKIKTPSMLVPILNIQSSGEMSKELKKFNKLRLKDVIDLPLKFKVNSSNMIITFPLKKAKEYKDLTNLNITEIIEKIENNFFKALGRTVKKCVDSATVEIKSSVEIEMDGGAKGDVKDEDLELDLEKVDFNDNAEKIGVEEENDEEEDVSEEESDDDADNANEKADKDDDNEEENDENVDDSREMTDKDAESTNERKKINQEDMETRKRSVTAFSKYFINYEVDGNKKPKWLKLTIKLFNSKMDFNSLLLNLIQVSLISEIKGIDKAIVMKTKNGDFFCTEGYNNSELFKYDRLFDLNKFHTNNIIKMTKLLGIEAAVHCIEYEIKKVFEPYSIEVNSRHLRLIAEHLTFYGDTKAFNRHAMKTHSSQIQRSSFETAIDTLNDMLMKANVDYLKSPTSNLLMGQVVSYLGSNAMQLFLNSK